MPALEVHGLVKIYGSRRVVDVVDFHVDSGEIVGLLGPRMELLGLDWHERCIRCDLLLEYVGIAQLRTLPAGACRAASDGVWRSLAAWCPIPRFSCWMNRSRVSIPRPSSAFSGSSATSIHRGEKCTSVASARG